MTLFPLSSPALYEQYENAATPAVDEWTLSTNMRADTARGGIQQLEEHYKTFIVSSYLLSVVRRLLISLLRPRKTSRTLQVQASIISAFPSGFG